LKKLDPQPPERFTVTIAVGIVKGERYDYAVEKAAECGAARFRPMITRHSVVEPHEGKVERWRNIALSAAKQSRNLWIMDVDSPRKFADLLTEVNEKETVVVCDKLGAHVTPEELNDFLRITDHNDLTVFIGPEGGFSDEELHLANDAGALFLTLGEHVLRTETAVPSVLAHLLAS